MKTTVEIADPVLREAKKMAAREGTTLRALIEQGLRQVVSEKKKTKKKPFQLITFGGQGLHPDLKNASWSEILDMSYGLDSKPHDRG